MNDEEVPDIHLVMARQHVRERTALDAALFAIHEEAATKTLARSRVEERRGGWKIRRTEAAELPFGGGRRHIHVVHGVPREDVLNEILSKSDPEAVEANCPLRNERAILAVRAHDAIGCRNLMVHEHRHVLLVGDVPARLEPTGERA